MHKGVLSTIGSTPLIKLKKLYPKSGLNLYAKLEMFNPGGSIKDRPALLILSKALEEGELKEGSTVVESSSGNMAIGLAQACLYLNLRLVVVVDPKINRHTKKILYTYGAEINMVTKADDSGNYLSARLNRVRALLNTIPDSYWPNQYANKYNIAAQYQTMKEIAHDLPEPPDYLLAATSTCGTIMGCADYVQKHHLNTKIVAVDAVGSVIFNSPPARRLIPGHGAGRPSELLKKSAVDHVIHMTDKECVTGCRRLLKHEAILAGGSSGAVITAIEKLQSYIPAGSTCAFVLPDSGERYLDTIYNDKWAAEHFGEAEVHNGLDTEALEAESEINFRSSNGATKVIETNLNGSEKPSSTTKIAIIGGGPKGTFAFERLTAQFNAHPVTGPVEIHIYNKTAHFGSGGIYRPGQPSYLLMNNPAGDINMWIAEDPPAVVSEPLSLTEWLQKKYGKEKTQREYIGRGIVGRYLREGFQQIAAHLPEQVKGQYIIGEVININEDKNHLRLELKMANGKTQKMIHRYDNVLLATGHPRNQPTEEDENVHQFVEEREHTGFIPFIYPVEDKMTNIPAGSKVAVKGIGLTFVDAVLALTEGKGGTFKKEKSTLLYQRSGDEPEGIYAFSRSGLPMIPRGPVPEDEDPLIFFTEAALCDLHDKQDRKLDFRTDILPLLNKEMVTAFYNVKLKRAGFKDDLLTCESFAEVKHHITVFHQQNSDAVPFYPSDFLHPLNQKEFACASDFNRFIRDYLAFWLKQAKIGELKSPWAAATAVWRKATPLFGECYAFGGLNPQSHHYFDKQLRPGLNRVTFGPPVESVQKILALMDANILHFDFAQNPTVQTDRMNGSFTLRVDNYNISQAVQYLIDARISKVSLTDDQAPLYQNLLNNGLISRYSNESEQRAYQPGCMAISREGFVIDKKGKINNKLAVTGTPSEGITFDNDALSRHRNNVVSGWASFIRHQYAQTTADRCATR